MEVISEDGEDEILKNEEEKNEKEKKGKESGHGDQEGQEAKSDNLKLIDRDRELFSILLSQKFLSFDLIALKFNPELLSISATARQNSGLYRRVRRLVQGGYLKSTTVAGKPLYLLTDKGLSEVEDTNGLSLVSPEEMCCIDHDLVASEIRFYLESHGGQDWCADREFKPYQHRMVKLPDGAIVINNQIVFLEVEFSQKSRDRYDGICRLYRWEKGPPNKVLYVYKRKEDLAYLMSLIGPNPRFAFFPYVHPLPPPEKWGGCRGDERFPLTLAEFMNDSPN